MGLDFSRDWQIGFQDPATPIMEGIIDLHNYIFFYLIVVAVFIGWVMGRILWRFSYKWSYPTISDIEIFKNFTAYNQIIHGTVIEIVWTLIPTVILYLIAIPSFTLLYAMDEIINPTVTIKIIAHQWYWSYEYGDNASNLIEFDSYMVYERDLAEGQLRLLEVDNAMVVPVKTHIRLIITSGDVLHSWAIPSFGIKVDAVPGRLNQIGLYVKREGTFYGQCSELCGVDHGAMPIKVQASAIDPFLFQTFGFTGLGVMAVMTGTAVFVVTIKYAMESYEIHVNVIQKGTQMLLEATLGHEAGVNREVFDKIFELFKTSKLSNGQQVTALKALMNNIIEYRDTHAISELEGKKLQQVADELKRIMKQNCKTPIIKAGWVPGAETAIAKIIVGVCVVIVGYYTICSGYAEYQQIVEQHAQAVISEVTSSNMPLPPLETLTDIATAADKLSPQGKVTFLLDHKNKIISLAQRDTLSEEQKENLKEIINFLTQRIEDSRTQANKIAMQDFIKECNNYIGREKK
ncbi:hypothetical protein ACTFIR_012867 [Dictyostelium discoideum]